MLRVFWLIMLGTPMSESSPGTWTEDPDLNTLLCGADRKGVADCIPHPPVQRTQNKFELAYISL